MMMPREIATITIGVLVSGLVLGFGLWWAAKSADRMSHDPRYRRRVLIRAAVVYIVVVAFIIVGVAARKESVQALYGLPAALLFLGCFYARQLKRRFLLHNKNVIANDDLRLATF